MTHPFVYRRALRGALVMTLILVQPLSPVGASLWTAPRRHAPVPAGPTAMEWYQRGAQALDAGQWAEAVEALQASLALDPTDSYARQALATAYDRLGNWEAAERTAREGTEMTPADPWAWVVLGFLHHARHRDITAQQAFAQALTRGFNNVPALLEIGRILLRLQDPVGARAVYDRLRTLDPTAAAAFRDDLDAR